MSQFSINPNTGAPTLIGNFPSGSSETWVAVDRSGKFVYAASNADTGDLYGYSINASGLQLLSGFPVFTSVSQRWAATDPRSDFIYIAQNLNGGEIAGYSSDPTTGVLTAVPGSPVASGQTSLAIAVDSEGEFLYSVDYNGQSLLGYRIDSATGALSPIVGAQYSTGYSWAVVVVTKQ